MLFTIIREPKTTFEPLLKRTLTIIVTQLINKLPMAQFKSTLGDFFTEFFDPNVSKKLLFKDLD
jgi:hypothetical protein